MRKTLVGLGMALVVVMMVALGCRTSTQRVVVLNPIEIPSPSEAVAVPAVEATVEVTPVAPPADPMAIFQAVGAGDLSRLERLLGAGADVNIAGDGGRTALHQAVSLNRVDVVKMLLIRGANPNAAASDGATPLHFAVWDGRLEIVKALIERGADVNAKKTDGWTPLKLADFKKDDALATLLREHGAGVE